MKTPQRSRVKKRLVDTEETREEEYGLLGMAAMLFQSIPWWWHDAGHWRDTITVKFDPHDIWVGIFWNVMEFTEEYQEHSGFQYMAQVYICLIPCFPIRIAWIVRKRPRRETKRHQSQHSR